MFMAMNKGLVKKCGEWWWAAAFENMVVRKHLTHPHPFGTNLDDPPLNEG